MGFHPDDFAAKNANESNRTTKFKDDIIFTETLLNEAALLKLVAVLQDVVFHQRREPADVELHSMQLGAFFGRQRKLEVPAGEEFLNEVGVGESHNS